MTTLYHYTCGDGHAAIGDRGYLNPGEDGFIWLTDLDAPVVEALGLTRHYIKCDRTQHRYRVVDTFECQPWMVVRGHFPLLAKALEGTRGAMPRHWWVAVGPLEAVYDPVGGSPKPAQVGQ